MRDYNHITIVGIVDTEPREIKFGKRTKTRFVVAVNRSVKRTEKEEYDNINVSAFGKLGEICSEYLKKGERVIVDGTLGITCGEKNNKKKWLTEIMAENIRFLSKNEVI